MPELIASVPHLGVLGQETIHRPLGAEVHALVEQGGVHLTGRETREARGVQVLEHGRTLGVSERPRRRSPRGRAPRRPTATVVRGARQPEGRPRGGEAHPGSDLGDRRHHEGSVLGVPSNAATCFCSSTSASARSARFFHRLNSRSCAASFLSRGSTPRRPGPRFFGAPASSPRSRAPHHVVRCEEYSPSRRSNAPIAPGVLQSSASPTIARLYSTANRRRVAFATTSIAGPPTACPNPSILLRS